MAYAAAPAKKKPCCTGCSGGARSCGGGLGSLESSASIALPGVLVVGGLLWLMMKAGR